MDTLYRMANGRGTCIIFNNKTFPKDKRPGSDDDAKNVGTLFQGFDFAVKTLNDITADGMEKELIKASKEDHKKTNCFICVILSYGNNGVVYGSDGKEVHLEKLIEPLKGSQCPSLIGKPKIFIIQSCRDTSENLEGDALARFEEYNERNVQTIPAEADILYVSSLVPGSLTWKKGIEGSLFINILTRVFKKYGKDKDILWLLTKINQEMAADIKIEEQDVPMVISMLTKDLILT